MKFLFVLSLCSVCFFNCISFAQNLVPNPSFEDTLGCPTGIGQIYNTVGWISFRGSPDYFNSCASASSYYSVPNNGYGYQQAASGNAYAGIICFDDGIFSREIIANNLTSPLIIGQKYFISFKINKPNETLVVANSINGMGAKLSTVTQTNVSIDNLPMVYTNSVVSDTVSWTTISGSFIADSAYQYLMIGNFFDDANTTVVNDGAGPWAYYLIDDVCLSTDSLLCDNFSVSIEENSFEHQFSFYPNPIIDFVTVQNSFNVSFNLTVFNALGQELYRKQNITSNKLQLEVNNYNTGFLFIKITSQNNQFIYKLLKQ